MEKKMIKMEDVVFKYKSYGEEEGVTAVDGVSFEIQRGEFVVILGHNGSGKSTLSKLMNALTVPTSGNVAIMGMDTRDEDKTWNIREKAGMVFQNPDNQIVATIVEEEVAFGPENLGVEADEIKRRVENALKVVEMTQYRKHAPHLLSGGQKQRIAIAGILAMNPECIIFDEPTSMLDPLGRIEVMNTIKKLNREEGKTIVLITHYMDEAVQADRIIVMSKGQIVMEGRPKEVFNQVDKIKELGLDVPQVTELAYELRKEGINIPADILEIEEMLNCLQ